MVGEFPTIYLSWPWCSGELFWIIHAIFEQHLFYRYKYRKIGNSNIFWPIFSLTDWLTELQKWSVWLVTVILKTVPTPDQDKYHRFPDGDFAIVSHPVGRDGTQVSWNQFVAKPADLHIPSRPARLYMAIWSVLHTWGGGGTRRTHVLAPVSWGGRHKRKQGSLNCIGDEHCIG